MTPQEQSIFREQFNTLDVNLQRSFQPLLGDSKN